MVVYTAGGSQKLEHQDHEFEAGLGYAVTLRQIESAQLGPD